jgi:diguanylate cyclase
MSTTTSFLPVYDFSPAINALYLKEIVPLLVSHNIAANPINYAICYDYVSGCNPKLTLELDRYFQSNQAMSSEVCIELYRRYVCNASIESFEKMSHKLQRVINQTNDSLSDTVYQAEITNDRFQQKSALLAENPNADVKQVLQEIIDDTRSLAQTSSSMQEQLHLAQQELEQLREELAQVRQMASTDGLTGLLNRRAFDQALSEVIEHADASQSVCLALLDIDHFKRVNDTYGHTIGDNVIKFVASLMKKFAQAHHHVARYGGEELAIIMPDTDQDRAVQIAENIRQTMEVSRLKRKDNSQQLDKITVSIGIAQLNKDDSSESLISRADKALYQAKEYGRNRVILGY